MKNTVCFVCEDVLIDEKRSKKKLHIINFYKKIMSYFWGSGSFSHRKTYDDLIQMDDHLLRDIGLHRETLRDSLRQRR